MLKERRWLTDCWNESWGLPGLWGQLVGARRTAYTQPTPPGGWGQASAGAVPARCDPEAAL